MQTLAQGISLDVTLSLTIQKVNGHSTDVPRAKQQLDQCTERWLYSDAVNRKRKQHQMHAMSRGTAGGLGLMNNTSLISDPQVSLAKKIA